MEDARARKFEVLMVWKLDRFERSLVVCPNNIQELERCRVRFIAVTQNPDTDHRVPLPPSCSRVGPSQSGGMRQ
jgi:DNA invertase Pin-like site-specific DNA recombinase